MKLTVEDNLIIRNRFDYYAHKHGRYPNTLLMPVGYSIENREKLEDIFGMRVVFAAVQMPTVGFFER